MDGAFKQLCRMSCPHSTVNCATPAQPFTSPNPNMARIRNSKPIASEGPMTIGVLNAALRTDFQALLVLTGFLVRAVEFTGWHDRASWCSDLLAD